MGRKDYGREKIKDQPIEGIEVNNTDNSPSRKPEEKNEKKTEQVDLLGDFDFEEKPKEEEK